MQKGTSIGSLTWRAELVSVKVDVIVATGSGCLAAKNATQTIPIVFAAVQDPVASGLVDSLAMPGGNVTGTEHARPGVKRKETGATKRGSSKDHTGSFFLGFIKPRGARH